MKKEALEPLIAENESEFSLTNRCKDYLEELLSSVRLLQSKVSQANSFAYFFLPGSPPLEGSQACSMAASVIGDIYYKKGHVEPVAKDSFSAIAVDEECIDYALTLNEQKRVFKQFHSEYRRRFPTERQATAEFRVLLKRAGHSELYIPSLDRQVPVLGLTPTQISWYYNTATVSRKKKVSDALKELYKLQDAFYGEKRESLDLEIARIEEMAPDRPVAHKLRQPYTALNVWATGLNEGSKRDNVRSYGRNPVLYSDHYEFKPHINLPPEISGTRTKSTRKGRPKLMKDEPLTPFLKRWFEYKDAPNVITEEQPKKNERHSKSMKTLVPGILLAMSPQKNPVFHFINKNGNRSSASISRYGLSNAWKKALEGSGSELINVNESRDFYSLCPSEDDLERFIKEAKK